MALEVFEGSERVKTPRSTGQRVKRLLTVRHDPFFQTLRIVR